MKKRIDFFNVVLSDDNLNFVDILNADVFRNYAVTFGDKSYEIKFLETRGDNLTVGLVVTTQVSNLPPSHIPETDNFERVQLPDGAGLSYANAFVFNPELRILLYEINGKGCHPTRFQAFVRSVTSGNEDFPQYTMQLNPVLSESAINKILGFGYYQKLKIKVADPLNLTEQQFAQNNPIRSLISQSGHFGARTASSIELTSNVKTQGLSTGAIRDSLADFARLIGINERNKVVIVGSVGAPDEENYHLDPVDLVADKMKESIELEDDVEGNLQAVARKREILNAHNRKLAILNRMFRNNRLHRTQ